MHVILVSKFITKAWIRFAELQNWLQNQTTSCFNFQVHHKPKSNIILAWKFVTKFHYMLLDFQIIHKPKSKTILAWKFIIKPPYILKKTFKLLTNPNQSCFGLKIHHKVITKNHHHPQNYLHLTLSQMVFGDLRSWMRI